MLLSLIKHAFTQNLKPAIALQLLAGLLVFCYYQVPATLPTFNYFAELKTHYGIRYSIISTAICGGLLPYLYLLASGNIKRQHLQQLVFYIGFWGWMGMCVDLLYSFQADLFGQGNDATTLAKKVAFDQFVYSTFYAAPFVALSLLWKEQAFCFRRWKAALNRQTFTLTIPANIASNWAVWIPAVTAIYAMPAPLQIPLFNVVLCFYVLLASVLNQSK